LYPEWNALYSAVLGFVANRETIASWSSDEIEGVLYAIARNNEDEQLAPDIRELNPAILVELARASLQTGEADGKWQLAKQLGQLGRRDGEEVVLLKQFASDENEYVRRQALSALATLGSPDVEALALEAWHRPHENQQWTRMMVLWCLHKVGSSQLNSLLSEAEQDSREYLREYAQRLRRDEAG